MTCTYVKLDINYSVGSDPVHKLKSSSFLLEVLVFEWFEVWFLFLANNRFEVRAFWMANLGSKVHQPVKL